MPLRSSDRLQAGDAYTFTFSHGRVFEYHTDDWVKKQLSYFLQNWGEVFSAERALLSGRYVITVIPKTTTTLDRWLKDGFGYSWHKMGYGNTTFVEATGGEKSSRPGGLIEALPKAGQAIGTTIGATLGQTLRPIAPYLIIVAGILLFLEYRKA